MSKSIYFDCTTGISGDMATAALLDLGADRGVLEKALKSINAGGFETKISRVRKSGIDACDFDVQLDAEHENHDHDMEYLFGTGPEHEHPEEHEHVHAHHSPHEHDGEHPHDHAHGHHDHRHPAEIYAIIDACDMTDGAKKTAKRTFEILAQAEAEAHSVDVEHVAFHEAGAIDSIVDIIAASVCIDNLAPERVYVPVLYEGRGTIRCLHGVLPVPVPAVVNIVKNTGLHLHIADYRGEYVTPTGAAFAAAVMTDRELPERFRIIKSGTGAGKRAYAVPGLLRAMMIEDGSGDEGKIVKLESNIDDSTGEEFGYVLQRLMDAGARDVNYFPVFMKKNRPAYQLNVVCMPEDVEKLEKIIFEETSTIGIRRAVMDRSVLARHVETVETELGAADVKVVDAGGRRRFYPEYSTAEKLAAEKGLPLRDVMRIVEKTAEKEL